MNKHIYVFCFFFLCGNKSIFLFRGFTLYGEVEGVFGGYFEVECLEDDSMTMEMLLSEYQFHLRDGFVGERVELFNFDVELGLLFFM